MYLPKRLLEGLFPSVLLEEYVFWQNTDDSLTGYLRPDLRDSGVQPTIIRVSRRGQPR
jgi:hypothetical protein